MKNIIKKGVCLLGASLLACSAFADTQQAPAANSQPQQVAAASNSAPAAPQANIVTKSKKSKAGKSSKRATKVQHREANEQQG